MRFLKWTGAILVILAIGVWFAASYVIKSGAQSFLDDMARQGLVARASDLSVGGFPTRLDLHLTDLELANPATGERWAGPDLHIRAASWSPWHITADLPATQELTLSRQAGGQSVQVASQGLTASVRVSPDTRVALQEVTAGGAALMITSTDGWTVGAGDLRLRLLVDATDAKAYLLTLDGTDLMPDARMTKALAEVALPEFPAPDLPERVQSVRLAVLLHLTTPLDLADAGGDPQLTGLDLQEFSVIWGPLGISASGTISPDDEGFAAGRIEIEITNWNRLPALLVAFGAVAQPMAVSIGNGLKAITAETSTPDVLKLPLVLEAGRMTLGPLPLGPAPEMARVPGG